MRSFGTIRTRVERLASAVLPSSPAPLFVCMEVWTTRCPSCAADLAAHARATALADAVARQRPGDPPPSLVCYSTTDLTACPHCDAPLT
jgi:hypothetical protein